MEQQKRRCAYLRKSRKDRALEDAGIDTLERHEKILRDMAKQQGVEIDEWYKETVSGDSIESRPEMQRLLKDVHNNKWDEVWCTEIERLARGDNRDQATVAEAFKYSETLIVTPSKTYDPNDEVDEEYFEFGLFMSRREYKTIKRRLIAGVRLSILEGNFLGPVAPYGYDILDRGRRDRTLTPNADADNVRLMFDLYTKEKLTFCQIALRLTKMGIPSPGGLPYWNVASVSKLIRNEVYIGKVHHGVYKDVKIYDEAQGKLVTKQKRSKEDEYISADGKHPPLVDMDTWNAACARHSKNTRIQPNLELANPLAGLLRCSCCGLAIPYKTENRPNRKYEWYRHTYRKKHGCISYAARYDEVISEVCYALENYIADFEAKISGGNKDETLRHKAMIDGMERKLESLKTARQKIFKSYEDDIYTEDEFLERKKSINAEIDELNIQIQEAHNATPTEIDYEEKIIKFSSALEALRNPDCSAKEKNELLKAIICQIDYTRDTKEEPFILEFTLL